ncbi:MAG: crotonase/enoyl-CoA hydratase family protein [Alphaproteobacteria bacterium]|nr:crotonase/enoyl-CoA hydratase family protein [Alphaproteobacteria bacterium]
MPVSPKLLVQRDGHVVTLTLNDPDLRNAISGIEMIDAIVTALEAANRDYETRCLILTGSGSAFSSGGNVKDMKDRGGMFGGDVYGVRTGYRTGIQRIPMAMYELEVPIIAAINGPAIGAGCDLACMCDIRIAGRSARMAESFVKLGIIPGDGGAWFLPRVAGRSNAMMMAFTGEQFGADDLLRMGVVSKVVDDAVLLAEARALADRIAVNPPYALRMAKRLIREGERTELGTLLDMSASMQAIAHQSGDHREAVDAFLEKRKPVFKGR